MALLFILPADYCPPQPMSAWWSYGALWRSKPVRTYYQVSYSQVTYSYNLYFVLVFSSLMNPLKAVWF